MPLPMEGRMESTETTLELGNDVVTTPTGDDLARAIAQRPRGEHWAITLNHGERDFMLAMLDGEGGVEVEAEEGGQSYYTEDAVDDARLQALFASFLVRDGEWRRDVKLSPPASL